MKPYRLIFNALLFTFLLTACAPVAAVLPQPTPTKKIDRIATSVAATVFAVPTFTLIPTRTALPTRTPTTPPNFDLTPGNQPPTPILPTALIVPSQIPPTQRPGVIATLTPIPGPMQGNSQYGCSILSQSPVDWKKFSPLDTFDAKWQVRNLGSNDWPADNVNFIFVSGATLHQYGSKFELSKDVASGGSIELTLDMMAPKEPGNYTAVWGLAYGKSVFCQITISIIVQKK